jgi:hypothetical protein
VPEGDHPGVAVAGRSGLWVAGAANGEDDAARGERAFVGADSGHAPDVAQDLADRGLQADVHAGVVQVSAEDADDVFGGLVDREDAAVRARIDLEAPVGQHPDDLGVREPVAGGSNKAGLVRAEGAEDVFERAIVGDVALATAADEDLGAEAVRLLEQSDPGALPGRVPGGDEPGRPGSHHDHFGQGASASTSGRQNRREW